MKLLRSLNESMLITLSSAGRLAMARSSRFEALFMMEATVMCMPSANHTIIVQVFVNS